MSWQGQWLGQWQGGWDGALTPAPEGSLTGAAAAVISAYGTVKGIGHLSGVASVSLLASGTLGEAEPQGDVTGSADLVIAGTGTVTAIGHLSGTATLSAAATEYVEPPVVEPAPQAHRSAASGGGDGAGRGWVYKDHAWVRLTKTARVWTRTHDFTVDVSTSSDLRGGAVLSRTATLQSSTSASSTLNPTLVRSASPPPKTAASNFETLTKATALSSSKQPTCETLELAELLAVLDLV